VPPGLTAHRRALGVVETRPQAATREVAKVAIDRLPGRKVMREQPPGTASARDGQDRIDHLAHHRGAQTSTGAGVGQQRLDQSPASIVQISRIALPAPAFLGGHVEKAEILSFPPSVRTFKTRTLITYQLPIVYEKRATGDRFVGIASGDAARA
jgi:hypothetical protein